MVEQNLEIFSNILSQTLLTLHHILLDPFIFFEYNGPSVLSLPTASTWIHLLRAALRLLEPALPAQMESRECFQGSDGGSLNQ